MRNLFILGLLVIAFISQGNSCATTTSKSLTTGFVDVMNAEKQLIKGIVEASDAQVYYGEICFIETVLGSRLQRFPKEFVDGINEAREALKPLVMDGDRYLEEAKPMDYCTALKILALKIRGAESMVQMAFKEYAPELIAIIPSLLLFQ